MLAPLDAVVLPFSSEASLTVMPASLIVVVMSEIVRGRGVTLGVKGVLTRGLRGGTWGASSMLASVKTYEPLNKADRIVCGEL